MKKLVMAVLITAATIATANAQPPAPGAPRPGPGGPGMAPPPPMRQLQQVSQFQGRVVRMNVNDDYVYDGFYMLNGSNSLLVKFPPHLGNQIVPVVKKSANVTVSGTLNYPPFGGKELRMVSLTAGGQTIYNAPPAIVSVPPVETFVNGSGKISGTPTDREGRVNGFKLDNTTILRVPPDVAYQLTTLSQNGATVAYTGMQKQVQPGEVASANYKIIHCNTITINGQQYMVGRPGGPRRP